MKVIIAGSRPPERIRKFRGRELTRWYQQHELLVKTAILDSKFEIDEVVSGKAIGFDTLGEAWATERHIDIKQFPADWNKHGKSAGPIRNREMANYADALIALSYGTPGTQDMISVMRKLGKPVFVLNLNPTQPHESSAKRAASSRRTPEKQRRVGSIQGKATSTDRVGLRRGQYVKSPLKPGETEDVPWRDSCVAETAAH